MQEISDSFQDKLDQALIDMKRRVMDGEIPNDSAEPLNGVPTVTFDTASAIHALLSDCATLDANSREYRKALGILSDALGEAKRKRVAAEARAEKVSFLESSLKTALTSNQELSEEISRLAKLNKDLLTVMKDAAAAPDEAELEIAAIRNQLAALAEENSRLREILGVVESKNSQSLLRPSRLSSPRSSPIPKTPDRTVIFEMEISSSPTLPSEEMEDMGVVVSPGNFSAPLIPESVPFSGSEAADFEARLHDATALPTVCSPTATRKPH